MIADLIPPQYRLAAAGCRSGYAHISFTDAPRGQALTIKDASKSPILGLVP